MDCEYLKRLSGNEIVEKLSESDEKLFNDLYVCSKNMVIGWIIKKALISEEGALELYHEAFITFIEKIQDGRLTDLSVAPTTYLITGVRHKLSEARRRKSKILLDNTVDDLKRDLEEVRLLDNNVLWEERFSKFNKAFSNLSERCRDILTWKCLQDVSYHDIALRLNLKSDKVAKTEKYKCQKKVRKLMNLL